jgi:hypothetical protein
MKKLNKIAVTFVKIKRDIAPTQPKLNCLLAY